MKLLIFLVALVSLSISVNAQKKIQIKEGDTLLVVGPGSINVPSPPAVKKPTAPKKKIVAPPVAEIPNRNQQQPIIINLPKQPVASTDRFSSGMIVLFSLMGAFALGGLILGIIAVSRRTASVTHHMTVHGGAGGVAHGGHGGNAGVDMSKKFHTDRSQNKKSEDNNYWQQNDKEKKKEEKKVATSESSATSEN